MQCFTLHKGNRAFADLRYGEEDSLSPSTLFVADTQQICLFEEEKIRRKNIYFLYFYVFCNTDVN